MYTFETSRTSDCDRRERGEWWRDQVSSIQCRMSFELAADYRGRIEHQRSDSYQVIRWWGDAEEISRDRQQVRTDPRDAYELVIPIHGALMLRQDDQTSHVAPTQMALISLDRSLDLRHGDGFSSIAFIVPRERLDLRLPRLSQSGVTLAAKLGLGRIVVDMIASLRENGASLAGSQFDAICDRIVDLLALTYNADTTAAVVDVQEGLVTSIRRFVRENAHDPGLTGAVVAARLGWSLRNIQTQLQRVDTTPSDLIREERLALARLRLQDPAWFRQSVTQVAYASGFGDLSTFSNAYRRHFGERPSDTRSAARDDA
ncbi:helix-turn-helix domain-containing protein [Nocardioides panzhihuensis]|uniref:AraC-like DNA-binding protein n=1 Tax=Nocardioides panzhihuensis TaxID=860243 RepID=A0A7Z0DST4_9ACTN|nr:AraC-like DNA-binding protein [Nocardioides panzhihuensis]